MITENNNRLLFCIRNHFPAKTASKIRKNFQYDLRPRVLKAESSD